MDEPIFSSLTGKPECQWVGTGIPVFAEFNCQYEDTASNATLCGQNWCNTWGNEGANYMCQEGWSVTDCRTTAPTTGGGGTGWYVNPELKCCAPS